MIFSLTISQVCSLHLFPTKHRSFCFCLCNNKYSMQQRIMKNLTYNLIYFHSGTQCTPPKIFTTCMSACPKTCANYNKPTICPTICKGSGCVCPADMVLRSVIDGTCVKPEECSKRK